jgi:5'-nucleotidase
MSAAVEASLEGIPAIGFSLLDHRHEADFTTAGYFARIISGQVLKHGLARSSLLNVNIPNLAQEKVQGIKICRQAVAKWEEEYIQRKDPYGRDYYWLTGNFVNHDPGTDTDEWALAHGYVSVVPVQYDLTAHHGIAHINQNWDLNP